MSMSISSFHARLARGSTSILDTTRNHINRIRTLNPLLNCVTYLSPDALSVASSLDAQLYSGTISTNTHPLLGIPILLKDNFDLAGTPTTAGCRSLRFNIAIDDGPVVARLKHAGAIILGKTNMHELALEGISVSSLAGQTRNPYDLSRTPGGSSGGSGAAVATGMCMLATGTDTMNSIRSPASACGVIGFRTTTGLVSTEGVQPVSWTQDVVGMIGRSVADVATTLEVIQEPKNPGSVVVHSDAEATSTLRSNDTSNLLGKRLGILETLMPDMSISALNSETTPVAEAMQATISILRNAGAEIIPILDPTYSTERILRECDTQRHEFRTAMNAYLQRESARNAGPTTIQDLYKPGGEFLVIPAQYEYIKTAMSTDYGPRSPEYRSTLSRIASLKTHLRQTFASHRLDAALYPQQKTLAVSIGSPSQSGRNGILAAVTGRPSICLPTLSDAKVPIGMEVLGLPWDDEALLRLAHAIESLVIEKRGGQRRVPCMIGETTTIDTDKVDGSNGYLGVEETAIAELEEFIRGFTPNAQSVQQAYPIACLS